MDTLGPVSTLLGAMVVKAGVIVHAPVCDDSGWYIRVEEDAAGHNRVRRLSYPDFDTAQTAYLTYTLGPGADI